MKNVNGLLRVFGAILVFVWAECAQAEAPHISAIQPLTAFVSANESSVLAYEDQQKQLMMFVAEKSALKQIAWRGAEGILQRAVVFPSGGKKQILVGYGYGRGALTDPIKLVLYDDKLENPRQIYLQDSPRGEINYLSVEGEEIYISYFTSKFDTVFGKLRKANGELWRFEQIQSVRLGMSIDRNGSQVVIGSPYPDELGALRLYEGAGEPKLLPVVRGVRAVKFWSHGKNEISMLVDDGWHQNYGKYAEARLALIELAAGGVRYSRREIKVDPTQYEFAKIVPVVVGQEDVILTSGNRQVDGFFPARNWQSEKFYEAKSGDGLAGIAVLETSPRSVSFAALDGNALELVTVPLPPKK